MGDFLSFRNGYNADKTQYGKGHKFINVLDIINNDFITSERIIGRVEMTTNDFAKNEVIYGDILFQRSSETREEVGQANVYLDRDSSAAFGGFVIRGRPMQELDSAYFNSLLKTSKARKEITSKSGGSTHYNVGQDTLAEVLINLAPTYTEQKKIAAFLTEVDVRIQQLIQKKSLLEDYKKGVMQQIFSQLIRFKDDHGNDFSDWEERTLGDVSRFLNGRAYKQNELLSEGTYPVLRVGNFFTNPDWYHSDLELPEDKYCETGDLLYAWSASFGPRIWRGGKVIYHYHIWKVLPSAQISKLFLFHLLDWDVERIKNAQGSGIAMMHITKQAMEERPFSLPSLPEQTKIANFFSALDRKVESVANQITHTQTFKKGLLQQMFV